jgi:hypothetical protein
MPVFGLSSTFFVISALTSASSCCKQLIMLSLRAICHDCMRQPI